MIKTFAAALISACGLAASDKPEIAGVLKGGASYGLKKTGIAADQILTVQTTLSVETLNELSIIESEDNFFAFACFKSETEEDYECAYARFRAFTNSAEEGDNPSPAYT